MDIEIDPRIRDLKYNQLQKKCGEYGLPGKGKRQVLEKNLNDYLHNPTETLKRLAKEKRMQKRGGYVDWRNHAAKEILLEDLEPNGWLYGKDSFDALEVYHYYLLGHHDIFEEVPFKQFEEKYKEYIGTAAKRRARSAEEEAMLQHDRKLHPRKTHNHRGEPVFDMDKEAKKQLIEDISNNLHKTMTPSELREHRKELYGKYKLDKFRQRIYQYKRRAKFVNLLQKKRNEKRDEFAAKMTPKEVTFDEIVEPTTAKAKTTGERRSKKRSRGSKRSSGSEAESRKRNRKPQA